MPFIARPGGIRVFFEVSGNLRGPTILMIRGLSRSSTYWFGLRPLMEKEHRVVVLDNRGVGQTSAPLPGFRVEDMADDCAEVLRRVGASHVFGMSLGGMIAQWVAIRHPSFVRTLTLGATTCGGSDRAPVPRSVIASFLRTAAMSTAEAIRYTAPITLAPSFVRDRPEVVDEWVAIAEREPRNKLSLIGQLLAGARHDASAAVRGLKMPVQVIVGDADTLIPPKNSAQLADRIPGAKLVTIPGGAHDFPTESPDVVAELLTRWIAAHPA
jgi:3-oxoadipate enol-lactonase